MRILFVRHGQTEQTAKGMRGIAAHDDGLDELGRAQARKAAGICEEFKPTRIYASPFRRTRETAKFIADKCDSKIIVSEFLKEYDVGDWGTLPLEEVKAKFIGVGMWKNNERKFTFRPPGGESWSDLQDRTNIMMRNAISENKSDATIVFVSHNAVIKAMVGNLQNKPFGEWLLSMYKPGSVTVFEYKNSMYMELFLNRH